MKWMAAETAQCSEVVIIGGGAAGLMCAIAAGRRGRSVVLIEHNRAPGAKILISGGGRCNFTNLEIAPERFISSNPHFCRSALSRYTAEDFIALVERHRIAFHEKTRGQLFCDGSARAILDMLLEECTAARVDLRCGVKTTAIERPGQFRITTERGSLAARALVLATGGLSIPKMGATALAYDTAARFGLALVESRPGLVPFRMAGQTLELCRWLSGVSAETAVICGAASFRESVLFTHRGLSGPAILQISSYWHPGDAILIDLLPELDAEAFLKDRRRRRPRAELKTVLAELLPARLAEKFAAA